MFSHVRFQRLLYAVSSELDGQNSFDHMQSCYSSHGQALTHTTKVEVQLGKLAATKLPGAPDMDSVAEFHKLSSSHPGGSPKFTYLNFMVDEMKTGRYCGPLHLAALMLHYLQESSHSPDGLRAGEFTVEDVMKVVRVALVTNSYNLKIMNDFDTAEPPESGWVEDTANELFSRVSVFVLFKTKSHSL